MWGTELADVCGCKTRIVPDTAWNNFSPPSMRQLLNCHEKPMQMQQSNVGKLNRVQVQRTDR